MQSTHNLNVGTTDDVRDFLFYGAPHSIAFHAVHLKIFHQFIDLDKYGFSKHAIDKGQYYTFLTANFLHNDIEHLMANTIGFISCCHRMIACNRINGEVRSYFGAFICYRALWQILAIIF